MQALLVVLRSEQICKQGCTQVLATTTKSSQDEKSGEKELLTLRLFVVRFFDTQRAKPFFYFIEVLLVLFGLLLFVINEKSIADILLIIVTKGVFAKLA